MLIPSAFLSAITFVAQTAPTTTAPTSQPAPWYMTNPLLMPILLAVEAVKSELRNPTSIEMAQATVADTDCYRLFRRKTPLGKGA